MQYWLLKPLSQMRICELCLQPTQNESLFCKGCLIHLPWLTKVCVICAVDIQRTDSNFCSACIRSRPPFDKVIALFHYQWPLNRLVAKFKYAHHLYFARTFAVLMKQKIVENYGGEAIWPQIIIPVPLTDKRICRRGFNQSLELAKILSKQLKIPINNKACRRNKSTLAQTSLNAKVRKENLQNAFCCQIADFENFVPSYVAIVDDVMTTGSTVIALTNTLKSCGVQKVDVWVLCRTSKTNKS